MASYSSRFRHDSSSNLEEIANTWADLLFENTQMSMGEDPYEFIVYYNGNLCFDSDRSSSGYYSDFSYEECESQEAMDTQSAITMLFEMAKALAKLKKSEHDRIQREAAEKIAKDKEEKDRQMRLKQFEKLAAEFGANGIPEKHSGADYPTSDPSWPKE